MLTTYEIRVAAIAGCSAYAGMTPKWSCRKQRQIVVAVADAAERLRRPQRIAPRKPERAERIGIGQPLQHAGRQAGAQPDIAHGVVGNFFFLPSTRSCAWRGG